MSNNNCQYKQKISSDTHRQEQLGVQHKGKGPIKSNTSDTRLSFQSYDHSVGYDPIDVSEEYNSAHNYHFGERSNLLTHRLLIPSKAIHLLTKTGQIINLLVPHIQ